MVKIHTLLWPFKLLLITFALPILLLLSLFVAPLEAEAITTDFYPDASVGSTTTDGYMLYSSNSVYATARTAANGTAVNATAGNEEINETTKVAGVYVLLRQHWGFDTSTIPSADVISAATLRLCGDGGATSNTDSTSLDIVTHTPAVNNNMSVGDYNITNFGSTVLGSITYASWLTGSCNTITLNSSGLAAINKGGITNLGGRTDLDVSGTAPTGSNLITAYNADNGTLGNRPRLEVTYDAASSSSSSVSLSATGGILGSGSLVLFHNACNTFSGTGSGAECTTWDTSIEVPALHTIFRQFAYILFSGIILFIRWIFILTLVVLIARWFFRIITLYKSPFRRRR